MIGEAFRYSRQALEQVVRSYGITLAQLGILHRVVQQPGLSGADVARQIFITPQAAHVALTTLESKGLIGRASVQDTGRAVRSVLTAAGQRVVDACRADTQEAADELAASLTADERQVLLDLLQRYIGRSLAGS